MTPTATPCNPHNATLTIHPKYSPPVSKEIKVGLLAIVAIAALVIGFNFLRGSNLLSSAKTYYATYPSVEGLNAGAPVVLNGIKVGQVKTWSCCPIKATWCG